MVAAMVNGFPNNWQHAGHSELHPSPGLPISSDMCDSFWCVQARAIIIWGLAVSPCREFVGRSSFRIVVIVVMGCSFRLVVISQ